MDYRASRYRGKWGFVLLVFLGIFLLASCSGASDDTDTTSNGEEGSSDTAEATLPPAEAGDIVIDAPDASELYDITNTTDGEELYVMLCSKCHGLGGIGDGPSMGSLHLTGGMTLTILDDRTDEELLETITYGKGVDMPAWGLVLNLEQRESILAYVRTLGE